MLDTPLSTSKLERLNHSTHHSRRLSQQAPRLSCSAVAAKSGSERPIQESQRPPGRRLRRSIASSKPAIGDSVCVAVAHSIRQEATRQRWPTDGWPVRGGTETGSGGTQSGALDAKIEEVAESRSSKKARGWIVDEDQIPIEKSQERESSSRQVVKLGMERSYKKKQPNGWDGRRKETSNEELGDGCFCPTSGG